MSTSGPTDVTVLLLDDEADQRELYAEYLRAMGFSVRECSSPEDAWRQVLEEPPDVVVADGLLHHALTGWDFARSLRVDPRLSHIPVILITGYILHGHARSAALSSCQAVLYKPCLPDRLAETIRVVASGGNGPLDI